MQPAPTLNLEGFDAGISHLHAGTVLAVLEDRVVQIQLVFRVRDDIVGPNARIIELAEKLELPIVIRFINQRWLGKDTLQSQFIAESPR